MSDSDDIRDLPGLPTDRRAWRPTIKEVARDAGVGVTTASRILRRDPSLSVRAETRERVERASANLGYQPNEVARSLRARRADTLAVVLADPRNVVWAPMLDGIEEAAAKAGYLTVIVGSGAWQGGDRVLADLALGRTDGVLVAAAAVDGVLLARLDAAAIPVVVVHGHVPGRVGSVNTKERAGGRLAADHLIDLGHERTSMLTGSVEMYSITERTLGFSGRIEEAGLPPPIVAVPDQISLGGAASAVASLFQAVGTAAPTAIFVPSFLLAVGAMRELRRLGIRVPEDVSVIALPDHTFAEDLNPALSAVRVALRALGSRSVEMLIDLINGTPATDVILEEAPQLMPRASTARSKER